MKPAALLICGALGKEVKTIVDQHGWDVDIYGVPAMHHFYPRKIVDAVGRRLEELAARYARIVVVYGDCGTAGALEKALEIAAYLELPLEVRAVGLGELESRLTELVEVAA